MSCLDWLPARPRIPRLLRNPLVAPVLRRKDRPTPEGWIEGEPPWCLPDPSLAFDEDARLRAWGQGPEVEPGWLTLEGPKFSDELEGRREDWIRDPEALPAEVDSTQVVLALSTYRPPRERLLGQLESLAAQTLADFQLVIRDDGSGEGFQEVLTEAVGLDSRFHLVRGDNRGVLHGFEAALELAATIPARAYGFVDQDDLWDPEKLEVSLEVLDQGAALANTDCRLVDGQGELLAETFWTRKERHDQSWASLLVENQVTGAACLFRRDVLERALPFPLDLGGFLHDHWIALVAASLGPVVQVERALYRYVQHGANVIGHFDQGRGERVRESLRDRARSRLQNRAQRNLAFVENLRVRLQEEDPFRRELSRARSLDRGMVQASLENLRRLRAGHATDWKVLRDLALGA